MKSIRIPAQPHDSLNWEMEMKEAARALDSKDVIFWEFDLGLSAPHYPLEDELRFQTLSLGLAAFTKEVWPQFEKGTAGALLYRGAADFSSFFSWTDKQQENWTRWKEGRLDGEEAHLRRLFCAEAFAAYFQMLAHKLPDELPLTLHLNAAEIGSLAQTYHLLAPERFEHFVLRIEGMPEEERQAQLGVCFPPDVFCSPSVLEKIDDYMERSETPFRVVYESVLSEQWEGLDSLVVWPDALSVQGKRKLKGFEAAGGVIIEQG